MADPPPSAGPPTVSVVVPVWNGSRYLGACLESLLAQDHPAMEVVVVDDGSTDGSADLAAARPGVRVVRRPHEGLAPTRNAGVAASTGALVGFCDSDDRWLPEKASALVAHLAAHPGCDVVLCRNDVEFEDGAEWPSWLRPDQVRGDLDGVGPTSGLFRRQVFDEVAFRADLGTGADFELLVQLRRAGFQIEVLDRRLWVRRIHGESMMDRAPDDEPRAEMLRSVRDHLRQQRGG